MVARLIPNNVYRVNGVTVCEEILPDGKRWTKAAQAKAAGFKVGRLYKKEKLLCGTGKAGYVTIHNTEDLKGVDDDAEQYARATYNENMGSARVHFYVDDISAWQTLKAGTGQCKADLVNNAEVGWHAGDGSKQGGGNMSSIAIEIIMNDNAAHDKKARDNGARLAAWLLWKNGLSIDKLVTHTYWVNRSAGKTFANVDEQCTNPIKGEKWCPAYIFASNDKKIARKNWESFKTLVNGYLSALRAEAVKNTAATTKARYRVQAGAYGRKSGAVAQVKRLKAAGFEAFYAKDGELYKVQAGAFDKIAGAKTRVAELKAAGFSAFIAM